MTYPVLTGGSTATAASYLVSRSLRFNNGDFPRLSRTPAVASNQKTWTFSAWLKRTSLGDTTFFAACSGTTETSIGFFAESLNVLQRTSGTTNWNLRTTEKFRDFSAWYHVVVIADTPSATASDRVKIYVNNRLITSFSIQTLPTQDSDTHVNSVIAHSVGDKINASNQNFDGYLADVQLVDGLALLPSDFAELDAATNQWRPKNYAGTYGTNGFHLDFSDNSAATDTAIGKDTSGNGNNWTPTNLSVADGSTSTNWTLGAAASISTAQSKAGGSSIFLNGTNGYIAGDGSSKFAFGTGDFTIEFWLRPTVSNANVVVFDFRTAFNSNAPHLYLSGGSPSRLIYMTNFTNCIFGSSNIAADTWYHIAVCRVSGSTRLFVNGVREGSTYADTNSYTVKTSNAPVFGASSDSLGAYPLPCYIDNLIIYKGYGKYASSFSPPDDPGTFYQQRSLALISAFSLFNGTNGSTTTAYQFYSATNAVLNDAMVDTPQTAVYADTGLGGEVRGNYCTWNPVDPVSGTIQPVPRDGALRAGGAPAGTFIGTMMLASGKWYFEITIGATPNASSWIGVAPSPYAGANIRAYGFNGQYYDGSAWSAYSTQYANGDIVGVALDLDGQTIEFYRNGVSLGQKTAIGITSAVTPAINTQATTDIYWLNAGQRPFAYAAPSGFKALCATNLP